jgi:hypothetical protein
MLEDARAKKWRLDPLRSQRRNFGKVNGRSRSAHQWRMSGMIVVARGDHCRRAAVLNSIRICVKAVMQLRRGTQRERPDKCRENANRNKRAPVIYRTRECAHCAASLRLGQTLRKKFLQKCVLAGAY